MTGDDAGAWLRPTPLVDSDETFPRNVAGKTLKRVLQDQYRGGR